MKKAHTVNTQFTERKVVKTKSPVSQTKCCSYKKDIKDVNTLTKYQMDSSSCAERNKKDEWGERETETEGV